MRVRKETNALVYRLSMAFPGFTISDEAVEFWDAELRDYSEAQLAKAARDIMRHHQYGPPSLAIVFQAIEGRVVRRQVPLIDAAGRGHLEYANGPPKMRWVEARVGLDGQEMPEVPEERRLAEGPLDPRAAGLIEGLAGKAAPAAKPQSDRWSRLSRDAQGLLLFRRRLEGKANIGAKEERELCKTRLQWDDARYDAAAAGMRVNGNDNPGPVRLMDGVEAK